MTSTGGYGIHPFNDPALSEDFNREVADFNADNYHIYAAEWMPTQEVFLIDNVRIRTLGQSSNYPMQFMLGGYEIPYQLNAQSSRILWPKKMEVDYIRGYQPIDSYGRRLGFG